MPQLRLRYENGHFTPLDPLPVEIEEGTEITVLWNLAANSENRAMSAQIPGMWSDLDEKARNELASWTYP